MAKKPVHPSEFTFDFTSEFPSARAIHLAETSIPEGTHVEYRRNAIDLCLYASMH